MIVADTVQRRQELDEQGVPWCANCHWTTTLEEGPWIVVERYKTLVWDDGVPEGNPDPNDEIDVFCSYACTAAFYAGVVALR